MSQAFVSQAVWGVEPEEEVVQEVQISAALTGGILTFV